MTGLDPSTVRYMAVDLRAVPPEPARYEDADGKLVQWVNPAGAVAVSTAQPGYFRYYTGDLVDYVAVVSEANA